MTSSIGPKPPVDPQRAQQEVPSPGAKKGRCARITDGASSLVSKTIQFFKSAFSTSSPVQAPPVAGRGALVRKDAVKNVEVASLATVAKPKPTPADLAQSMSLGVSHKGKNTERSEEKKEVTSEIVVVNEKSKPGNYNVPDDGSCLPYALLVSNQSFRGRLISDAIPQVQVMNWKEDARTGMKTLKLTKELLGYAHELRNTAANWWSGKFEQGGLSDAESGILVEAAVDHDAAMNKQISNAEGAISFLTRQLESLKNELLSLPEKLSILNKKLEDSEALLKQIPTDPTGDEGLDAANIDARKGTQALIAKTKLDINNTKLSIENTKLDIADREMQIANTEKEVRDLRAKIVGKDLKKYLKITRDPSTYLGRAQIYAWAQMYDIQINVKYPYEGYVESFNAKQGKEPPLTIAIVGGNHFQAVKTQ